MALPYAELIGDPVEHSKSPLIHKFWLEKLGLKGDYRTARMTAGELPAYLKSRRSDPCWRGCNVTAPLKEEAAGLVGTPAGLCDFVGAVNCITRTPLSCLVGTNTDLAGIAEALADIDLEGAEVVLIGAGGAARAVLCYLVRQNVGRVTIAARNAAKADKLVSLMAGRGRIEAIALDHAGETAGSARLVVNATPMGMAGGPPWPAGLVGSLGSAAVFDIVYAPLETPLLAAARARGAVAIDGLAMLIGQAAPAFELFFGRRAPREHDAELRALLTA